MRGSLAYLLAIAAVAACASARQTPPALIDARRTYNSLEQRGASRRFDADMERAKAAIDRADSAINANQGTDYVNAVSDIALRLTQATEAKDEALAARHAADSLRAARLARLLTLSESQRAELAARHALSQMELEQLRARNLTATHREDSLRLRENEERARGDSLRRVAELAQREADSLAGAARSASRQATDAERQRSDSLRRVVQDATQAADALRSTLQLSARTQDSMRIAQNAAAGARAAEVAEQQRDSAQRAAEQSARERDSLRAAAQTATQTADSLREVAAAAARARDSLRALNSSLTALQGTLTGIRTIRQTERGLVISLSGVLFDVSAAELRPGAARSVRRIAEVLEQYPAYQLSVEGHTDSVGRAERNQALSERRAEAVKAALVVGGVDAGHVTTKGFGATVPVATNRTAVGRQQNRRVEIVVAGSTNVSTTP